NAQWLAATGLKTAMTTPGLHGSEGTKTCCGQSCTHCIGYEPRRDQISWLRITEWSSWHRIGAVVASTAPHSTSTRRLISRFLHPQVYPPLRFPIHIGIRVCGS